MSGNITKKRLSDRRKGKTDCKRVDALTDADISKAIQDDPDTFEVDRDWFEQAMVLLRRPTSF